MDPTGRGSPQNRRNTSIHKFIQRELDGDIRMWRSLSWTAYDFFIPKAGSKVCLEDVTDDDFLMLSVSRNFNQCLIIDDGSWSSLESQSEEL